MIKRESFEAWYSDNGHYPKAIERNGDTYKLSTAHAAWQAWQPAWQASRRAALEEVALQRDGCFYEGVAESIDIGAAIRALAQKEVGE